MTARRTVLPAAALALALAACGSGESKGSQSAQQGTALLAQTRTATAGSDAVSFRVQSTGSGASTDESFARRGADSAVTVEQADNGRNEVRRIDGVVYMRSDLDLPDGQVAPWIRIDLGADQTTWVALVGEGLLAPTPKQASALFAANVARVTALTSGDPRVLSVDPRSVRTGERPATISIAAKQAQFVGRSSTFFVGGQQVAQRTYTKGRWGSAVAPITAPSGAVTIEAVRDPQSAALPSELLRGPAGLPAGWTLRAVVGITPGQGDNTCQQVLTLHAATGQPISAGYLAVYLKPAGCDTPKADGAADFTAGKYSGWIGQADGASIGGLSVDGVSVRFRSSLPQAQLAQVLATWKPLPA